MAVNQRLVSVAQLADAFELVRRDKRRLFLRGELSDLVDGVRAMGELDFARLCRRRGLPEPDRQVARTGPGRRIPRRVLDRSGPFLDQVERALIERGWRGLPRTA